MSDPHPFLVGYSFNGTLCTGDDSIVYRAIRVQDQRPVLIKTTRRDKPFPREVERLRHEYGVVQPLDLPSVPKVYTWDTSTARPFLALEDCGGVSLQRCLDG